MENNRGGTSIEELMRNSASSSDDDSVVNSILNEINQDKETQIKSQQDNQMMEQQKMLEHQHQQRQQQEMYEKQLMIQKQRQMENQKMMEQRRIFEQNKLKAEQENLLEKADSENTNRNKLISDHDCKIVMNFFKKTENHDMMYSFWDHAPTADLKTNVENLVALGS